MQAPPRPAPGAGSRLARRSLDDGQWPAGIERLSRESGFHPEVVRRFVRLGLVDTAGGTPSAPVFRPDAGALLARAARLRRDLALSYAGAILACELLARIEELEARLDRYEPRRDRPR
jgi:chaperone modulatory protein CbpM